MVRAVSCPDATSLTTSANGAAAALERGKLARRHGDEHAELAQIVGGDADAWRRRSMPTMASCAPGRPARLERELARLRAAC